MKNSLFLSSSFSVLIDLILRFNKLDLLISMPKLILLSLIDRTSWVFMICCPESFKDNSFSFFSSFISFILLFAISISFFFIGFI